MVEVVYGDRPETILRKDPAANAKAVNHVLLGTYLEVQETDGDWLLVGTRNTGKGGWVHKNHVRDDQGLKLFYVDVGQGDGALVEHPGGILVIDGGPTQRFHSWMRHRYKVQIAAGETVHIGAMVVSHPDSDHYKGFIAVLKDPAFTVGTIFHNGIYRYPGSNLPPGRDFDLGRRSIKTVHGRKEDVLTETFNSLDDIEGEIAAGRFLTAAGNETDFHKFWDAALKAKAAGRLSNARRITVRNKTLPGFGSEQEGKLHIEVLGPVPTRETGKVEYVGFPRTHDIEPERDPDDDPPSAHSSHTRNGHSLVLKLTFGEHSFLFGGDLNIPAQLHLERHYGTSNPFRVDVAKACHHGSSDFSVEFLKQVRPRVNVVSSGDNKSFDHPVADAMGALARHTTGTFPLLFSTELARAVSGQTVHYGLINARSNGKALVMAQMKEQHKRKADVWDSFSVPWKGRFHELLHPPGEATERLR